MTHSKDQQFWDKVAEKYARSPISDMAGYERSLERTMALLSPHDAVLELGCGTGTTALRLANGVSSYDASDLSPQMIAIAQEKLAAHPLPGLSFAVATAETYGDARRQFSAVLAFNCLHLVSDLATTLRTIWSITRPGGLFISKTPCVAALNPLIRMAIPVAQLFGKAPHVVVFSAAQLQEAIKDGGFTIVATEWHASKGKDVRPYIVAKKPEV